MEAIVKGLVMRTGVILNVESPAMSKLIWCILYVQRNKAIEMYPPTWLPQILLLWCHVFLSFFCISLPGLR